MSYNQPPPPPPPGGTPPPPPGGYSGPPQPGFGGAPTGVPRPAELLNRFLARLIDHVLLGVVFGILWGVLSAIFLTGFTYSVGEWFLFYLFLSVISVAVNLAYFGLMESNRGQTVGKMLLKLRTYGPDGVSNPTLEQALKRNGYLALNIISVIPILGAFVAGLAELAAVIYIAVTLNSDVPNHQGWHDKFAGGTRVMQIG
ncbi:RDD family protein [Nocardioides nitrophenolicus]|uniref:RDD family protein n=1 Tax=Nocardioides nitrophenolicus TaxID=60489 RepID=UPI0019582151|nr:RDD family protein [Nocardioides nitrophenolicus]MBM7518340.1 putative RDD family membrane protein YckC [Nocardioides nitrophenolicus]